jgi:hypothetical protein
MSHMRKYIDIIEARADRTDVSYEQDPTKVTATVSGAMSGKYTKLAMNLQKIDMLTGEIKALQEEAKQSRREDIAGLFDAEDAVLTRVIDTKSAIFTLSKDPKETETPQYKKILEEFEKHLTPELINVLNALKKAHVTVTQKEPSLKYDMKNEAENDMSPIDELVAKVNRWLPKFDAKFEAATAEI